LLKIILDYDKKYGTVIVSVMAGNSFLHDKYDEKFILERVIRSCG